MPSSTAEPIRRILFPTDFSDASKAAFGYAERLAGNTGADLLVLHVFGIPDVWGTGGKPDEIDAETKRQLTEIQPSSAGIHVEHVAHGGPPGEVICWIAQEHKCDQIVMGTHGHTGLARLFLGSVAEYVVGHARCPVLTIRQPSAKDKPLKEPEVYLPMPPVIKSLVPSAIPTKTTLIAYGGSTPKPWEGNCLESPIDGLLVNGKCGSHECAATSVNELHPGGQQKVAWAPGPCGTYFCTGQGPMLLEFIGRTRDMQSARQSRGRDSAGASLSRTKTCA